MAKKRRARRFIARHRRSPAVRKLASAAEWVRRAYENFDYDPARNGERFVLEALRTEPLGCVFDVGANVGKWSVMAREVFPKAEIHAFEVMPETATQLEAQLAGLDGVTINRFGLSDREGPITVSHFPSNSTWTTITDYPHDLDRVPVESEVTTGDAYLERNGIDRVELLKIDVEGAEHLVLAGFAEAIDAGRVDAVQFEYGRVSILTKYLLGDFHEFFEARGYAVGKIFPNYVDFRPYTVDDENFLGSNHLAVRRERGDWIDRLR